MTSQALSHCLWVAALTVMLLPAQTALAPDDHPFSGYNRSESWRSIYLGRFDLVRPANCTVLTSTSGQCATGNYDDDPPLEMLRSATALSGVFVEYHRAWHKACAATSPEAKSEVTYEIVTKIGGISQGGPRPTVTYLVRDRFQQIYRQKHLQVELVFEEVLADLRRLLKDQGCGSPIVRRFEENLHRAVAQAPSVQAQFAGLKQIPLFAKGCQAVLKEMRVEKPAEIACPCVYQQFVANARPEDIFLLEDNFVKDRFLWLSFGRLGVREKVGGCLR